jgi:hypothetical protein
MAPSESAPQELSNEWSCQYVLTILNFLGNFSVPLTISTILKELGIIHVTEIFHHEKVMFSLGIEMVPVVV